MPEENNASKVTESTIKIPFNNPKHAEIAYRVLSVDKEPRRNFVQKELRLEEDVLIAHFTADQVKNLRTATTAFFESLLLCQNTIKKFGDDAGTHTGTDTT